MVDPHPQEMMLVEHSQFFLEQLEKCKQKTLKGKLMALVYLPSNKEDVEDVFNFVKSLDKVIDIQQVEPDTVVIQGFQDGLCRFKLFNILE